MIMLSVMRPGRMDESMELFSFDITLMTVIAYMAEIILMIVVWHASDRLLDDLEKHLIDVHRKLTPDDDMLRLRDARPLVYDYRKNVWKYPS